MTDMHRRIILFGVRSTLYLMLDRFINNLGNGAVNNTPATPGGKGAAIANLRNVVDSGNKLLIDSGKLVANGITGNSDPLLYYGPFTRVGGLTARWICNWTTARSGGGWTLLAAPSGARPTLGISDVSGLLTLALSSVAPSNYQQLTTGMDYTLWASLFDTVGGAVWAQGGTGSFLYNTPTLLWVDQFYVSGTPAYFAPIQANVTDCSLRVDDASVSIVSSLNSPQKIASVYISNPATGVNFISDADALHYMDFTLPGSPSAGNIIELRYRYQDANNYWTAYVKRNAGNTAWDFFLDLVSGGTPTNKISVAGVGTPTKMCVVVYGTSHFCFTFSPTAWTKRGGTITDSTFQTNVEVGPVFSVGSVELLSSFRRTWGNVSS